MTDTKKKLEMGLVSLRCKFEASEGLAGKMAVLQAVRLIIDRIDEEIEKRENEKQKNEEIAHHE